MPYGYSGGACAWARHLRAVYRHDEYTGHPAAAESLLNQMHRAERRCGGGAYGYNTYSYRFSSADSSGSESAIARPVTSRAGRAFLFGGNLPESNRLRGGLEG